MKSLFSAGPMPLLLILLCCGLSCKGLPKADIPAQEEPQEDYGDTDYARPQDDGWPPEDDAPSLVLPPDFPSEGWPAELDEPFLENGEAFLPDQSPEEGAIVLAEPLPEPLAPDLPLSEPAPAPDLPLSEPAPAPAPEPEPGPAEESAPEESPALSEPPPEPEPVIPPPPPRIVRPAEPIPPPPRAREPLPLPPNPVPDLPARNPPVLTPVPVPGGVSSRVVRAAAGQIVEVPFRGTGWVYLGESDSKRGINYNTRRLDPEGQTFIFQAVEAGTYELKFYRQDFIRDYLINDLVTVIVEDAPLGSPGFGVPVDRGRVIAEPRWPTIPGEPVPVTETAPPVPPDKTGAANTRDPGEAPPAVSPGSTPSPGVSPQAAIPETEDTPLTLPPETPAEEYLRRAREEYGADHIPEAIAVLDQFMAQFPLGSDEALWLYAQLYEKQGPFRDIRLSLDYYRRLVKEYPQSNRYDDSRRRIAYLERYYINIQ